MHTNPLSTLDPTPTCGHDSEDGCTTLHNATVGYITDCSFAINGLEARCTWCMEPASDFCLDLIGRSNPIGPGGYGPLCDTCSKVNNYLWEAA